MFQCTLFIITFICQRHVLLLTTFCPAFVPVPSFVQNLSSISKFCPLYVKSLSQKNQLMSTFCPYHEPKFMIISSDNPWTNLRFNFLKINHLVTLVLDKNWTFLGQACGFQCRLYMVKYKIFVHILSRFCPQIVHTLVRLG